MCWNCLVNQSDELSIPNSGDPFVRLIYGASGSQVHGSAARPTHNPQLFWWRGRQFRSQWQRRYMVLCIPLPFWSTHIAYSAWGIASSDGNVYIWDRDRAILLNVLTGHGSGSVNSVAWNPPKHADVCVLFRRLHHTPVGTFGERVRHRVLVRSSSPDGR